MTSEEIRSNLQAAATAGADAVKKAYYRLCLRFHPDRPTGDTEIMKLVNSIYDEILEGLNGKTFSYKDASDNWKQYTYRYNREREQWMKDKIAETLAAFARDAITDCNLLLVGSWLWIDGNTRPNKETFKALKFRWHSKRSKWYWHLPTKGKKRRFNSKASFGAICAAYGCEDVTGEQAQAPSGGAVARSA